MRENEEGDVKVSEMREKKEGEKESQESLPMLRWLLSWQDPEKGRSIP